MVKIKLRIELLERLYSYMDYEGFEKNEVWDYCKSWIEPANANCEKELTYTEENIVPYIAANFYGRKLDDNEQAEFVLLLNELIADEK